MPSARFSVLIFVRWLLRIAEFKYLYFFPRHKNTDKCREQHNGSQPDKQPFKCMKNRADTAVQRLSMLEKKRSAALEEIHFKERQLQRLDYLRHEIRKTQGGKRE